MVRYGYRDGFSDEEMEAIRTDPQKMALVESVDDSIMYEDDSLAGARKGVKGDGGPYGGKIMDRKTVKMPKKAKSTVSRASVHSAGGESCFLFPLLRVPPHQHQHQRTQTQAHADPFTNYWSKSFFLVPPQPSIVLTSLLKMRHSWQK